MYSKKLQIDDFIMLKLCQQNDDALCTYVLIFVIIISVKCAILMMIVMIMCTCVFSQWGVIHPKCASYPTIVYFVSFFSLLFEITLMNCFFGDVWLCVLWCRLVVYGLCSWKIRNYVNFWLQKLFSLTIKLQHKIN